MIAGVSTLPALVAAAADRFGSLPAIEDGDRALTFAELHREVTAAARGLRGLGVRHGDRVAIWAPNRWEWVVSALAIHAVGGVLVPINTRYKREEARDILARSGAVALFTVRGFLGVDYVARVDRPELPKVVFDESWSSFLDNAVDGAPVRVRPDDPSDILFTSGTTGRPKGVVCSHEQTIRVFAAWAATAGLREGDRYLVTAPFFHCFGYKAGFVACLLAGATVLPQAVVDVDGVLARVARDRVTVLPGPPALYQGLLQRDRSGADLGSLRLAVTGAASVPVALVERMRVELGFETVLTAYGLTECCGVATMCRPGDAPATIARTAGRPIDGVEIRVVGPDGVDREPGEAGEILVRGYNVMQGYLDDPAATADAIRGGWLHTGDVGVLDADGNLRITDRMKDMFIVGGFNAYPAEIESMLAEHAAVAAVAVVGVPDERLGEVGRAFIVARKPTSEAEILAWARERMANFKVPRRVVFVDELPRNASGKVVKSELPRG